MPPFLSTSKALRSLVSRSNGLRQLVNPSNGNIQYSQPDQCRCYSAIAGVENCSINNCIGYQNNPKHFTGSLFDNNAVQTRQFTGFEDGEEGFLSKIYEEKRVLGYSQEQLFEVVAAVDLYRGSAPWCRKSEVLKHYPDGSFDAELEIGFKFLFESYISHFELDRPNRIKTTVLQSTLFDHLINIWEFNPGPIPGTCNLYFFVDSKFQSPLDRQVASMFFKKVASRMVGSFTERCRLIYGPEVPIVENSLGERA